MDSTLNEGLAGIRALRDEYDENCIKVIKAKTRVESLEKVIADKESETCQLNKNIENLDDQIVLLESQLAAMDVTIDHYRQVKRSVGSDLERQKIDYNTAAEELLKMKKDNEKELSELKLWQDGIKKELLADGIEIDSDQLTDEETVDEEINAVLRQIQQGDEDMEKMKAELRVLEDQMSQKESIASAVDELTSTIKAKKQKIADLEKFLRARPNPPQTPRQANAAVSKSPAQPVIHENPMEEDPNEVRGTEPVDDVMNVTAINIDGPGPSAQSTPMVMSSLSNPSLKGLINTTQVNKMMLSSSMHQQAESPIPQRKLVSESASSNQMEMDTGRGQGAFASPRRYAPDDLSNNHLYGRHQPRYESQVVQHQYSPSQRQGPKIVTVQSPTFSSRSSEASPRSAGQGSAGILRSPLTEESEKDYMMMKKSSQEYMMMKKSSQPREEKESDSGASFGSFGFSGKFGFSSRDDNQDDDNNGFGGFSGSGGGFSGSSSGFGFSF